MSNNSGHFSKKTMEESNSIEKVIRIDRVNKVVKGGKRLAFRAFVIVGDLSGKVGFGLGKSKEVPVAIRKGIDRAKKYQYTVEMMGGTVPHEVTGRCCASCVLIKPAPEGTGVIAGGSVRILLEAAGFKDVVAKSLGARNPINMAKAALDALLKLKSLKKEEERRGRRLPVRIDRGDGVNNDDAVDVISSSSPGPISLDNLEIG